MSDIVKVELQVEVNDEGDDIETPMAVLVKNVEGDKVWLPKSEIEIRDGIIEMPEWLAEKKELI